MFSESKEREVGRKCVVGVLIHSCNVAVHGHFGFGFLKVTGVNCYHRKKMVATGVCVRKERTAQPRDPLLLVNRVERLRPACLLLSLVQ